MKKTYVIPYVREEQLVMPRPIMVGGSIEKMNYGETNVFGDDDDEVKQKEDKESFGYEREDIQNSLW